MKSLPLTSSLAAALIHKLASPKHDPRLVKQAQRLVSQTFFGAMLKQMRQSPFKSKIFDGGRGGDAFSSMLDQHLADRMAVGAGKKLVTTLCDRMDPKGSSRKQSDPPEKTDTRELFKRSGYSTPAVNRRPYVPTDFRA